MPSTVQSSPRREELIAIASRLFYAQGYGATGIKQIIDEANMAKGTLYSHVRSKEELGLAWLQARHQQWNRWLTEAIGPLDTPRQQILGLFDFLARWMKDSDYRGCAFLNTLAETPDRQSLLRAEIASHKQELRALIQELTLRHLQTCSSAAEDQLSATANRTGTLLFLLFEGALIESQNFQQPWPIETARQGVDPLLKASL